MNNVDEEWGPIEMVHENQLLNVEFQHTQDTPAKVKELKEKKKVRTHFLLHLTSQLIFFDQNPIAEEESLEMPLYQTVKKIKKKWQTSDLPPLAQGV